MRSILSIYFILNLLIYSQHKYINLREIFQNIENAPYLQNSKNILNVFFHAENECYTSILHVTLVYIFSTAFVCRME